MSHLTNHLFLIFQDTFCLSIWSSPMQLVNELGHPMLGLLARTATRKPFVLVNEFCFSCSCSKLFTKRGVSPDKSISSSVRNRNRNGDRICGTVGNCRCELLLGVSPGFLCHPPMQGQPPYYLEYGVVEDCWSFIEE